VEHPVPGDATLFYLVWLGGIAFCIVRYRFMAITPEYVGSEVLSGIDESVILLDRNKTILAVNRKTCALAGREDIAGGDLSAIISEHGIIAGEIDSLLSGAVADLACRLHLLAPGGGRVYMDARISPVRDRFGDVLGVLIIGREVKELSHIRLLYRTTPREMEIIQRIIDGRANAEIAAGLSISENTLKRHISNIYNKMGVNNKIELFRLMKEFNLMPLYTAGKTLLVANR
jgi:DNA-binding CsgD family transcriptional regulator